MLSLLRSPSGYVPLLISGGFLLAFIVGIANGALAPQRDEGTGAHLFQLLMPLQLLIVAYFAITQLPRHIKAALTVLLLQCAFTLADFTVVNFRHL
jgi:hypothetical protein